MFEIEPALLAADLVIGAFEHREIELVLVADVIIQHPLVGAGVGRDAVDARTGKPVRREFLLGGFENAQPHPLGIALPFQSSLCRCFRQTGCSLGAIRMPCNTRSARRIVSSLRA
ncbi:hypothetical protein ACVWZL_001743 [Bradyrhizobium sp. GM2.4]